MIFFKKVGHLCVCLLGGAFFVNLLGRILTIYFYIVLLLLSFGTKFSLLFNSKEMVWHLHESEGSFVTRRKCCGIYGDVFLWEPHGASVVNIIFYDSS